MPAGAYLDEIPRSKPNLTSTTLTRSQVLHLDAQPMAPAEIRRSWRPGCLHHELPRPRQGSEWRHGRSRYPLRSVLRPGHLLDLQVRRLISPRRASLSIADCSPFLSCRYWSQLEVRSQVIRPRNGCSADISFSFFPDGPELGRTSSAVPRAASRTPRHRREQPTSCLLALVKLRELGASHLFFEGLLRLI